VGGLDADWFGLKLAQKTRPRGAVMTAAAETAGGSERVGHANPFPAERVTHASLGRVFVE
jgi:hypothetical protein